MGEDSGFVTGILVPIAAAVLGAVAVTFGTFLAQSLALRNERKRIEKDDVTNKIISSVDRCMELHDSFCDGHRRYMSQNFVSRVGRLEQTGQLEEIGRFEQVVEWEKFSNDGALILTQLMRELEVLGNTLRFTDRSVEPVGVASVDVLSAYEALTSISSAGDPYREWSDAIAKGKASNFPSMKSKLFSRYNLGVLLHDDPIVLSSGRDE